MIRDLIEVVVTVAIFASWAGLAYLARFKGEHIDRGM